MSKKDKLSIEKCRRLLGKDRHYTDVQVEKIRDFLYELAEIQFQNSILNGELDEIKQNKRMT
jgi:hypothetical protein